MCRFTHFVACAVLYAVIFIAPLTVQADITAHRSKDPAKTLSLQQAMLRIEESPSIKSADKSVDAAKGNLEQAELWLNPEIAIEVENFGGNDDLEGFVRCNCLLKFPSGMVLVKSTEFIWSTTVLGIRKLEYV